ncbi:DUF2333 family protein [Pseudomaricurvus alcaniphilus]|uniref:DUF2333 family protein n=1 Tax=Pseudomaricurvus alcaniphilus TaxID=1166482 RepID=UPI00140AAF4F|nr:DUF2333 family protein [Pseudomaricurvus alcaniphilus]NHN38905.1 DUF2333 family protein [Pseudomaricurvus alcaniphilus]
MGGLGRVVALLVVIYLLVMLVLGWFWSSEPDIFSVRDNLALQETKDKPLTGVATTSTLAKVTRTLLDKPGGFMSNDVMPPGIWLDNIPKWEYGVLIQVRDLSKAMREAFSRSQSQSTEDLSLAKAESRFNFDHRSWALPASESEYRDGITALEDYLERLTDADKHNAQFFARADNLRYWLSTVETRLGSLSQRLSASVGQRRLNTDLAGEEKASRSTSAPAEMQVKTAWMEIDDVFYEARGSAWALLHFLRAIEIDFADTLGRKNAQVSVQQIIRELEATQATVYSPMILNGSGLGMLANHSLVMASYISRANAAIIDLRELLSQG